YMSLDWPVKGHVIFSPSPAETPAARLPRVPLESIQRLIAADMQAVDALIRERLDSDVVLIRTIAEYIIGGGGKRLRPALVLLASGALGYRGRDHHELAAVIEFIHTAPRPQDRERRVRQRGERAGRRLPVLARVPDDGGPAQDARDGSARRRDQH